MHIEAGERCKLPSGSRKMSAQMAFVLDTCTVKTSDLTKCCQSTFGDFQISVNVNDTIRYDTMDYINVRPKADE